MTTRAAAAPSPTDAARTLTRRGGGRSARERPPGPDSAFQLRPGLLPLRVVHAVVLAVAARGHRRLPELDRVEVLRRRVRVVLRARALGQLVHDRARLRVRLRPAE